MSAARGSRPSRPSPSAGLIAAAVIAAIGYALPWFRGQSAEWWYSGLEFAQTSGGGGWTLLPFVFLLAALIAGVWAGGNEVAAVIALVAVVAAAFLAGVALMASISAIGGLEYITDVTELPFGIGLPIMALGFGAGIAAGCYEIAASIAAATEARIRARLG